RSHDDLLNDFEMATEGNGDLPVPDLRTMDELCQPSLNGRGGPISPIAIQATKFEMKNDMIQQSIKVNGVTDDALHEAITKEMHDGLGRATTNTSSLEAEQGSGNISKTQTKATPSSPSSPRTSSKGGLGYHVAIGDNICTKLSNKVTTLENELTSTKAVYNTALITLTKRVKKLEKKLKHKRKRAIIVSSEDEEASLNHEDSSKKGRMIKEIDEDKNVNLVQSSKQGEAHEIAEHRMDLSTSSQIDDDETLAETLLNIKRSAAKDNEIKMFFNNTMESIRKFVPMGSEGQVADSKAEEGSSKEGKSLKRPTEEELGQEQEDEEEIV
nr:reverse transcriptase domain-containing protein [Tanacetum cinerariifolium]